MTVGLPLAVGVPTLNGIASAVVVSYDVERQTAVVQVRGGDPFEVEVAFPRSDGFGLTWLLHPGDRVDVVVLKPLALEASP